MAIIKTEAKIRPLCNNLEQTRSPRMDSLQTRSITNDEERKWRPLTAETVCLGLNESRRRESISFYPFFSGRWIRSQMTLADTLRTSRRSLNRRSIYFDLCHIVPNG